MKEPRREMRGWTISMVRREKGKAGVTMVFLLVNGEEVQNTLRRDPQIRAIAVLIVNIMGSN